MDESKPLLDGSPPSQLPLQIIQHPVYIRTFGIRNFDVAATEEGVLETCVPLDGRYFYSFYLTDDGRLRIEVGTGK